MTRILAATFVILTLTRPTLAGVITFENLTLPPNSYENGANLAGSFVSNGAIFNNYYDTTYGSWDGWSYSNVVNNTTAGYGNQYAAFSPTGGDHSANYAVAYSGYTDNVSIDLPGGRPLSMSVTNTTYAALSMRDGDMYAKKFGGDSGNDPDFLLLTISGKNSSGGATGTVEFYLADFRFANNASDYIVSDWTTVDLSGLGEDTTKLFFNFTSTDNSGPYINTPTYFAMDNLVTAAPEPGSLVLAALGAAAMARMVRRRLRTVDGSSARGTITD